MSLDEMRYERVTQQMKNMSLADLRGPARWQEQCLLCRHPAQRHVRNVFGVDKRGSSGRFTMRILKSASMIDAAHHPAHDLRTQISYACLTRAGKGSYVRKHEQPLP